MKMPKPIRKVLSWCRSLLWQTTRILPVNHRKITVVSFYGRGFSGNAKVIVQEILDRKLDIEIVWAVKNLKHNDLPDGVKPIKYESLAYIYHMATAGVWIDNCRKWQYVVKKPSQLYINTYHALPFKQVEADAADVLDESYIKSAINDSKMCNLFVSNSGFMTELYRNGFWYEGEVLECGSPRNDIFFQTIDRAKICQKIGVDPAKKLVLYAPTFRRNGGLEVYDLNYHKIIEAHRAKFGGQWKLLLRLHPNIAAKSSQLNLSDDVIDVSMYDDMQELLTVADSLIIDYSSSIFDYILTNRPCFMYANDFAEYNQDRGLYFELDELPFKCAFDQDELLRNVADFKQAEFSHKNQAFQQKYNYKEKGHAAKSVTDWLVSRANLKSRD